MNTEYPMPVCDYLYSLRDNAKEHECISMLFQEANEFINFLELNFSHVGEPISLLADPYIGIRPRLNSNNIIITRGFIDLVLKSTVINEMGVVLDIFDIKGSEKWIRIGGLLYVVAHEYFHYVRNHNWLFLNRKDVIPALEYDADCYAMPALYRYMHCRNPELTRYQAKLLVLKSFYWPVRELIGVAERSPKKKDTHADWELRLRYLNYKLSCIDVPHPNYGITAECLVDTDALWNDFLKCESQYLKNKGAGDVRDSIFLKNTLAALEDNNDAEARKLARLWSDVAKPLVISKSKMKIDVLKTKAILHLSSIGSVLWLNGWNYSRMRVTGIWVPVFHNRPGKNKPSTYADGYIKPNAYWISASLVS